MRIHRYQRNILASNKLFFSVSLIFILLLASCSHSMPNIEVQGTNVNDNPQTFVETKSPTPTNTSTVTPTPTATPVPIPLPNGALMRLGNGTINTMMFSPDDKDLIIGTSIGVYLYDVATFELKNFIRSDTPLTVTSLSPDGKYIAGGSSTDSSVGLVYVWNTSSGELLEAITGFSSKISSLALSPDGTKLASGLDNGLLSVTELSSKTELYQTNANSGRVNRISFSPDGSLIASAHGQKQGQGCTVLWDSENGQQVKRLNSTSGPVYRVAFSPNGKLLAIQTWERQLLIMNTETYMVISSGERDIPYFSSVSFSMDNQTIKYFNAVSIVEKKLEDLSLVNDTGALEKVPARLVFSTTGKYYSIEWKDGSVALFDSTDGNKLSTFEGFFRSYDGILDFSSDGALLAAALSNDLIAVFDLTSGEVIQTINQGLTDEWVNSLSVSENKQNISALVGFGPSLTWDLSSGKIVETSDGFDPESNGNIYSAVFSPNKDLVAMENENGKVDIFTVSDFEHISTINSNDPGLLFTGTPSFSYDNQFFYYSDYQKIYVHDSRTGELSTSFSHEGSQLFSLAMAPDNNYLAGGDWDGNVTIWNRNTGEITIKFPREDRSVGKLIYSPDGSILTGTLEDLDDHFGTDLVFWDSQTGEKIKSFSDVGGYAFSPDGKLIAILSGGTILLFPVR